jgi:hypothetical protein
MSISSKTWAIGNSHVLMDSIADDAVYRLGTALWEQVGEFSGRESAGAMVLIECTVTAHLGEHQIALQALVCFVLVEAKLTAPRDD